MNRVFAAGVADFAPGDHVIGCLTSWCGVCKFCTAGRPYLCPAQFAGRPPEQGPRISDAKGQPLVQFANLSSFAERMLCPERSLVKIRDDMPLDRASLIGCGVTTGLGAALNTVNLPAGASVVIIGCGGVGLAALQGCLAFYPFFYPVGLWGTAHLGEPSVIADLGWIWLTLSALVFLSGWVLARGANLQKYVFKRFPERAFLGRFPPRVIRGGNLALLCGGFWGVARHVNYLGEILMATGLALSLGHLDSPWPWLYPLYYLALLLPRERDDDRRCAEKYGALWDEYRRQVPYRIVPRIY